MARLLAPHASNLDRPDSSGNRALHLAAQHGNGEITSYLLELGANSRLQNNGGESPLHLAIQEGHTALVAPLLARGADPNAVIARGARTPLHLAAEQDDFLAVQELLRAGADVDAKTTKNHSALFIAAERGHKDVAMALLRHRADPTITNFRWFRRGQTPLQMARDNGHEELAKAIEHFIFEQGLSD